MTDATGTRMAWTKEFTIWPDPSSGMVLSCGCGKCGIAVTKLYGRPKDGLLVCGRCLDA